MVLASQKWLNATYSNNSGYNKISEDGYTGWGTINALIRALQIELNISPTADNFGPSTISVFKTKYPNGIAQQADHASAESNIYGIIQCALWCKGYSTGSADITRHFYGGTGSAVKLLKTHMGISPESSTVTLNIMKALLSMDQFRLISGGNSTIREIQCSLNGGYESYIGIIPCDGYYGRSMNTALIKVLQAVEGLTPAEANGNFGPTTQSKLPILSSTPPSGSDKREKYGQAVRLLRFCLICNGYSLSPAISLAWDTALSSAVLDFQNDYALPSSGIADLNTWMSLLLSKGNPNRSAAACDTSVILNSDKAQALYDHGYRYIGRYLTGSVGFGSEQRPKNLTKTELYDLFDAGLRVFAIFQEGAVYLSKFTYEQGQIDASKAANAALTLGIPFDEIIYFAIDYDVMDGQINDYIVPYFKGINSVFRNNNSKYRVGIYGARNVCSRISSAGYAVSSFVSDMSTGFSGNMGYPIPSNWAFDQFHEYTFSDSGVSFALDKDAFSGRYSGFNSISDNSLELFKEILQMFQVSVPINLRFNHTYAIDSPIMRIEFSGGINTHYELLSDDASVSLDIINGLFSATLLDNTEAEVADMSTTLKAAFDNAGGFSMITSISNKLINANVSIGIGISGGFLKYTYIINRPLDDSGTASLSCKITFIFRNQPADPEFIAQLKAVKVTTISVIAIAAVIVFCYFGGSPTSELSKYIFETIERLLSKYLTL